MVIHFSRRSRVPGGGIASSAAAAPHLGEQPPPAVQLSTATYEEKLMAIDLSVLNLTKQLRGENRYAS